MTISSTVHIGKPLSVSAITGRELRERREMKHPLPTWVDVCIRKGLIAVDHDKCICHVSPDVTVNRLFMVVSDKDYIVYDGRPDGRLIVLDDIAFGRHYRPIDTTASLQPYYDLTSHEPHTRHGFHHLSHVQTAFFDTSPIQKDAKLVTLDIMNDMIAREALLFYVEKLRENPELVELAVAVESLVDMVDKDRT